MYHVRKYFVVLKMLAVYAHWVLLVGMTVLVSAANSYYLIKHTNYCGGCSQSKYIRETARKDVKAMAISFMALAIAVAVISFVSKFKLYSRYGFSSRANAARFNDIYLVLLYVAITYNVFSFMNFAAISFKCRNSSRCKAKKAEHEENRRDWVAVKTLNAMYFCVGVSYLFFRVTCPRQRFGVPSRAVCKRVLCRNKIRNAKELEALEADLKKIENSGEEDLTKQLRALQQKRSLYREDGSRLRGDQLGFFDEVRHQIRACAGAEDERITLAGFKAGSWAANCAGMSRALSGGSGRERERERERERRDRQKRDDERRDRRIRRFMREQREERRRERDRDRGRGDRERRSE